MRDGRLSFLCSYTRDKVLMNCKVEKMRWCFRRRKVSPLSKAI